ncbi:DUF302 domain-containing protein [Mycolicibacterium sp. CBMA 226]|uniref:DUF302 domain-containing protein n=1 Tax=Mycolicibacterium sp. CBMA 226 TaxID=2606611 RepID=UPI0012DF24A5|nr:DUF302 domain-containing protein [Mycolicibacterium sp. CBMA 226]MUL77026.1 DUF302 domain-containing protein [Mycolicibacterium sp. CBMA 226]
MPTQQVATDINEITTKTSPLSVHDTVVRLCSEITDRHMMIFAVIDHNAEAEHAGLQLRDTTVVIFGSPAAGTPVMEFAALAALDLPLKILIWADGPTTKVSYTAPQALAARYGLTEEIARNLAGIDALTDTLIDSNY